MNKQCGTCVSRCNKEGCLLGVDRHLKDGEKCGTYCERTIYNENKNDFEIEFGYVGIDEVNEEWLNGDLDK